jgi:hypothetical protein
MDQNQSLSGSPLPPTQDPPMGLCELNDWAVKTYLNISFNTCTQDCVGSTITDVLIAVHAFYMARVIFQQRRKLGGLSFTIALYVLVNAVWSLEGSLFRLQPRGRRLPQPLDTSYFGYLWKLNAQFEALLLFLFWKLSIELLSAADLLPPVLETRKKLLLGGAVAYAASFSIVVVRSCRYERG